MLMPVSASCLLMLCVVQLVSVRASSSCSPVEGVSSPADCMSVAVSRSRQTLVVGKKAGCFICKPFSSQLYPSHCGGISGCRFCVGYQFQRVSNPTRQLLLLRTHKDSRQSPYSLFTTGASNQHLSLTPPAISDTASYKSPLFDVAYEAGVSQVEVQLLNSSGEVAVRLRFSLKGGLKSDAWFSKERLLSSFPWSVTAMRQDSYNVFSIEGDSHLDVTRRRFYINRSHGGCDNDKGYLVVSDKEGCPYFPVPKPAYFWNPDPNVPWSPQSSKQADVFQLIGILDPNADTQVYTASLQP